MSKKRTIAGFDQVANDSNINNNDNNNNNTDSIKDLLATKKTKEETHIFKGYYLENEVANTIDRVTAGKTKGVKSELVNEILKKYFQNEGLM